MERILDFIPQGCTVQGTLHNVVQFIPPELYPIQLVSCDHVVVDAHHGKRVGFLENHSDLSSEHNRLHAVDIVILQIHPARNPGTGDKLVHPVHASDEGCLPATGRTHKGCYEVAVCFKIDVLQYLVVTKICRKIIYF
ncbi:MAG: hypothetical protein A4E58_01997 [Syntrophorhabdus sp. PtaB.Bin006]|nr:MAG: hypothetical protein A4E58_01997 [Syntrophorhabdus sp. PtaB.Bin006]